MKYNEIIKVFVATIGTTFAWLFGAWDIALTVLVCFMILDYITGVLRAFVKKEVSSNIGLIGIARKSLILVVLIVGVLLDRLLNEGTWVFRTLIAYFYIANEGISLLENCVGLGLPVPQKLQDTLIQLKEGNKKSL